MKMNTSDDDKEARQLRELFRGRFDQETAKRLIKDLGGLSEAVDFVLNENEEQVRSYMKKSKEYLQSLRDDSAKLASILDNHIENSLRQFVCGDCKRSWWKRVPTRKEVSKCRRCHVKLDPISREHEFGIGKFICPCGNEFTGFACMGETLSECYDCDKEVPVSCMIPPRRNRERKTSAPHSCNGVNCYNYSHNHHREDQPGSYQADYGSYVTPSIRANNRSLTSGNDHTFRNRFQKPAVEPPECVHPKSPKRKIRHISKKHISTGSTVSTFLSQRSLDTVSVSVMSALYSIPE